MKKRKILITGASKGLGLAIANKLAPSYHLILHASREDSFSTIIPDSTLLCADFSEPSQLELFCKTLKKEHGDSLFAVINNAGLTFDKPINYQPENEIDAMLNVNLRTPIFICKTAMKIFQQNKTGIIINMSSIVGEGGNAFQSVYAATKAGLVALSKSLAQEAAALYDTHNIRVLSISPGFIESNMTDSLSEDVKEKYLNAIPSKRFGKPDDVANLVEFLLSENASYINGTNIQINGGLK
jgi:3-oxoacyl-[acyl-carrier protein] reductase